MDKVLEKRVKSVSIIFIILSLLLILLNTWSLIALQSDEVIAVFHKFDIDVSYYINEQMTYHIVNFVFYISLLITSIYTYKLNNIGRLGFKTVLIASILYLFIAPMIFNSELPYPQTSVAGDITLSLTPEANSNISIDLLTYLIVLVKSAVVIIVVYYFSKNKVVQLFKTI